MHPTNSLYPVLNNLTSSWLGGGISTPSPSIWFGTSLKTVLVTSLPCSNVEKSFLHHLSTHYERATSSRSRLSCSLLHHSLLLSLCYQQWLAQRLTAAFSCMRRFLLELPRDTPYRIIDFVRVGTRNQGQFLQ